MATLKIVNGKFTVNIYKGDDEDIFIDAFRDSDGQPVDLSELYTNARFQIRRFPRDLNPILEKELGDGISITADSDGNPGAGLLISMPKEETAELLVGKMTADLEWTLADGTVQTMQTSEGNQHWIINVKSDVTR